MRGAAEAKQTFTHLHDHGDGGGGDDHGDGGGGDDHGDGGVGDVHGDGDGVDYGDCGDVDDDDDDDLKPRPPINGEELGGQYWNWISIII